jgi:hypothetical protein
MEQQQQQEPLRSVFGFECRNSGVGRTLRPLRLADRPSLLSSQFAAIKDSALSLTVDSNYEDSEETDDEFYESSEDNCCDSSSVSSSVSSVSTPIPIPYKASRCVLGVSTGVCSTLHCLVMGRVPSMCLSWTG